MKRASILLLFALLASSIVYAVTIPIKGYVNADIGLNVRMGPSEASGKIGALSQGAYVSIVSVSGRWYKISAPLGGYVHGDYVTVTEYGEAPEEPEADDLNDDTSVPDDDSSLTPEEANKIASDLDRSLKNVKITKSPPKENQ